MCAQLDKGVLINEIDIKLRLPLMKPLHAGWLVNFHNHITSGAKEEKLLIVDRPRQVIEMLLLLV